VLHGGAWQGFKSQILRFLDSEVTIIFLANSWETRDFKFARALAATVYPEFALPDVKVTAEVDPQVTSLMRGVLMQITTGTVDEKLFTPEALTASRREVIQNTLNALSLPVAVINSSEFIDVKAETNQRLHRFLLTDLGTSLICTIRLTTDNKIASLEITSLSAGQ
jgi:hypothetical protein